MTQIITTLTYPLFSLVKKDDLNKAASLTVLDGELRIHITTRYEGDVPINISHKIEYTNVAEDSFSYWLRDRIDSLKRFGTDTQRFWMRDSRWKALPVRTLVVDTTVGNITTRDNPLRGIRLTLLTHLPIASTTEEEVQKSIDAFQRAVTENLDMDTFLNQGSYL